MCLFYIGSGKLGHAQTISSQAASQSLVADCGEPKCAFLKVTRIYEDVSEPPSQTLSAPSFTPQSQAIPYGSTTRLITSSLPAGAIVEYSTDNGLTWTAGNEITITEKKDVMGRVRLDQLTSQSTKISYIPYFQRMMVIGNSIMSHGPAPDLGWFNFNGMAASAPEKDFVHILTRHLETLHTPVEVKLQSGGNFERQFGTSGYSLDEFNQPLQEFKPDLIIVRIGENIDEGEVSGARNLEAQFGLLLDRLKTSNQPVKVICTTSVWGRPQTDTIFRKVCSQKGVTLVDLSGMVGQGQYFASQYENPGVAAHPNDAGMQRIADGIIEKLP